MSTEQVPGQPPQQWRAVLRGSLADQVRRYAPAADVARGKAVLVAEWASPGRAESEAARAVVEPLITQLHVRARRIGARRGRVVALAWSIPVALVLALVALAVLLTGGGVGL